MKNNGLEIIGASVLTTTLLFIVGTFIYLIWPAIETMVKVKL